MNKIIQKLAQGDMRTIGRSQEVVEEVLNDNSLLHELFEGLSDSNPAVRMRAADALEKVTAQKPELLKPYKSKLVEISKEATQQEVQWHIAQMLGLLKLEDNEAVVVYEILNDYYQTTKSNIVKVMSLEAMCHIAQSDEALKENVEKILIDAIKHSSPSVTARAKKLKRKYYKLI